MNYSLGLYEKSMPDSLFVPEKLDAAKRAGFDFLELSVDETDARLARLDWSKAERAALAGEIARAGIHIDTICLSGHRRYPLGSVVPETARRSREILEKAVELAYDLGVRIIQLAAYDVYYGEPASEETRARFIENLRYGSLLGAKYGVILALETMENDFCNTVEKAADFVRAADSPYLKIYPDIGNVTNAVADPCADIAAGRGHIAAAHLKETLPGVFRNLKFGEGHVDFGTAVRALRDAGVRRFTAEFWHDGTDNWESELKKAHDFLREKLEAEGSV
jgi:L-ribulose-5-phosphate 3-epimerase